MQTRARRRTHLVDLHDAGGVYAVLAELLANGLIDGSTLTVNGVTTGEA